ncbi:cupin domain-containing protein [Nonomuraea sp. NPDC026600]|uniref:cupin domain-containing protein n=1 Tax=Nonomuraea sp. NPDC026600 TaxID=3155363 RepID=UPI0033E961A6
MSKDRFILLNAGESRLPMPPPTTLKAGAADTEGRFSLVENRGRHDLPSHVHDSFDELVFVLDGELGIDFDGRTHRLTAGMCALLPRGVTHAMRTLSEVPVHALHLSSPGGWEEDVAEAGPAAENGDKERFYLLQRGEVRPGRIKVPPAFAAKTRGVDTGGRLSLLEMVVAQDIPRHIHHKADEGIYVLDGELVVEFDDRTEKVGKGQFVLLPHGVPHALRCGSTPPPRVIQISSPGGWECFIEDLIEARPHITTGGRLDPVKLNPIAAKYDITYGVP